jgi:hypothetical protein
MAGMSFSEQVAGRAKMKERGNFKYLNIDGLPPSYRSKFVIS